MNERQDQTALHPEIYMRRFGRNFTDPCKRPAVIECAMWECQVGNACAWDVAAGRRLTPKENSNAQL